MRSPLFTPISPCQEARLLLRVRPAGVPVRMASRPVARRSSQPECELARLLRRGLEAVDGAERSRSAFAASAAPSLRRYRRATREGRGSRSPGAAVPGLAQRRADRASLAGTADLLGRAQSAGHQPIRPPTWRNAGWNRRHARGCGRLNPQNATPTLPRAMRCRRSAIPHERTMDEQPASMGRCREAPVNKLAARVMLIAARPIWWG
jgi:hypothetical protein